MLHVDPLLRKITVSNVIDFNKAKEKRRPADKEIAAPSPADLAAIEERNRKNEERLKKERAKDNNLVLRDYKIKD